jgi:hypothetical protein
MRLIAEIRCAEAHERAVLDDLHRRSSFVWAGDRANLEAHPDALGVAPEAIAERRVRVAVGAREEIARILGGRGLRLKRLRAR